MYQSSPADARSDVRRWYSNPTGSKVRYEFTYGLTRWRRGANVWHTEESGVDVWVVAAGGFSCSCLAQEKGEDNAMNLTNKQWG